MISPALRIHGNPSVPRIRRVTAASACRCGCADAIGDERTARPSTCTEAAVTARKLRADAPTRSTRRFSTRRAHRSRAASSPMPQRSRPDRCRPRDDCRRTSRSDRSSRRLPRPSRTGAARRPPAAPAAPLPARVSLRRPTIAANIPFAHVVPATGCTRTMGPGAGVATWEARLSEGPTRRSDYVERETLDSRAPHRLLLAEQPTRCICWPQPTATRAKRRDLGVTSRQLEPALAPARERVVARLTANAEAPARRGLRRGSPESAVHSAGSRP